MKVFTGKVVSKKMPATATIAVERAYQHPIYNKRIKRVKKYHVHDEFGVEIGDVVSFVACRPVSKTKKWKIIKSETKTKTKLKSKSKAKAKTRPKPRTKPRSKSKAKKEKKKK